MLSHTQIMGSVFIFSNTVLSIYKKNLLCNTTLLNVYEPMGLVKFNIDWRLVHNTIGH